jgi:hypothetical protein
MAGTYGHETLPREATKNSMQQVVHKQTVVPASQAAANPAFQPRMDSAVRQPAATNA